MSDNEQIFQKIEATTTSVAETKEFAAQVLKAIGGFSSLNDQKAVVVALSGNLGAGKTIFTQSVAEIVGVKDTVTSPTFVILKRYQITNADFTSRFSDLVHIDAYRLDSGKEMETLGFSFMLNDAHNLILIEWPEKIVDILPKYFFKLTIEHVNETTRHFVFEKVEDGIMAK